MYIKARANIFNCFIKTLSIDKQYFFFISECVAYVGTLLVID